MSTIFYRFIGLLFLMQHIDIDIIDIQVKFSFCVLCGKKSMLLVFDVGLVVFVVRLFLIFSIKT